MFSCNVLLIRDQSCSVDQKVTKKKALDYIQKPNMRQAKSFIDYSPKTAKKLLGLTRSELSYLKGLFTGHCPI